MQLLLDAHLSPAIAQRLTAEGTDTASLRDWQGGSYRHAPDDRILVAARAEERVLVTFDGRSILSLVKEWAQTGRHHAGVVVINTKTIRQNDIGGLIRALRALVEDTAAQDWQDRLAFLQSGSAR
jgi:predicted nuclease of predicted toxin-antitoxin system